MIASAVPILAPDQLKSRFLSGLSAEARAAVLSASSRRYVRANTILLNQGDCADYLFLVTKGAVRHFYITPEGKKILLFWLTQGQIVGGSALLSTPTEYLVGTEVVAESAMLVWHRSRLRPLVERFPQLLDNALFVATDYLTWYLAAHMGLICQDARRRLAEVVISLANGLGLKCTDGIHLEITNEQLANAANVTVFTASRIVSQWQKKGAVRKSRGKIIVLSPARLFSS